MNANKASKVGAFSTSSKFSIRVVGPIPQDFAGIPILNPMSSWFVAFQLRRNAGDVEKLWRVFQLALTDSPLDNPEFIKAFDEALTVRKTDINLTMGLFWIRPEVFLNLDQMNRKYLNIKIPAGGLNATFYVETLKSMRARGKPFTELSMEAWKFANHPEPPTSTSVVSDGSAPYDIQPNIDYWLVGAYWNGSDPADQTIRFVEEGIWENGYKDRFLEEVKSMKEGDRIAIKSTSTQRNSLPFDNHNKTVSKMTIKAVGKVISNHNDGRTVDVEWEPDFVEKDWFFYTYRATVWHLKLNDEYRYKDISERLRDFVWYGKEQDYQWFMDQGWSYVEPVEAENEDQEIVNPKIPYSAGDMIASGVFLSETELNDLLGRLKAQKALILQGPPGVGKTFVARKLGYALMEEIAPARLEMVQFHQSYSYDDFVRGYRPLAGQPGSFGLQNGIFYEFCQKAAQDPDQKYVFIIDEINRGNLSQIFGELLMLIEHDKRGEEFSVPLVYRVNPSEARFYIPSNLYIIGLMNVADRSLAMVDYALRRRFAFFDLKPQFESQLLFTWLSNKSMDPKLIQLITSRMSTLNKVIREDPLLGENYQIGHSYFCPNGENFAELDQAWYQSIVRSQIIPLLKEYWFDDPKKAQDAEKELLN